MADHDPLAAPDLHDIAQVLEHERPQLDPLELDALQSRVMRSIRPARAGTDQGPFMRSRTAITVLLTSGLLLTTGGTAIGISALQSTDDASIRQYGVPGVVNDSGTLAEEPGGGVLDESGGGEVKGEEGQGIDPASVAAGPRDAELVADTTVQSSRQAASSTEDSLPVTGYAAIPVLLLGAGLFVAGLLVMRRRPDQA